MRKIPIQTQGNTYTRFNRVLKCTEYLGYGAGHGTMNNQPQYFTSNEETSPLFEHRPVLTLITVCWMNPKAIIENVPIPDSGKQNRITAFLCHAYKPYCDINAVFNANICIQDEQEFNWDSFCKNHTHVKQVPWYSEVAIENVFVQERMFSFDVPEKFNGHKCSIMIEVLCNTGNWKCDWHFEGWSVVVN